MSGFGFAPTTAAPAFGTSSISFGTATTQNQPLFGFGATNTQAQGNAPGLFTSQANFKPGFGQPTQNQGIFGKPATGTGLATASTGLTFGAPANTTVTSNMPTFGAPAGAAPTLGAPTPLFGAATSTAPTFGAPTGNATAFGAPAGSAPAFGAPAVSAPAFGAPAASAPAFGAPTTSAPTFGALNTTAPAFGLTTSAPPTFGTATTTATTGFSFGGVGTTAAPSLSFGAPTTQSTGLFAAPTTTTAALSLSFPTTTKPALGLGSSTTAGGMSFGLGAPATTATATGLSFGLGGTTANALNLTAAPTPSAATVGLGGVQTTQTKVVTAQKEVPPKEQALPNEILQTVDQFKQMMKQQKLHSTEIARCSVKDFRRVEHEIDHFSNLLSDIESQLQKNRILAEKLKYDTAKCLQNVEMAQRTQETPPGLQYENMAPLKFFQDLADHFEREMQILKLQIESAEKYVRSYCNSDALTAQDLAIGMRRLYETFVALAGRLQSVHSQVESQKEYYLNFRKQLYNDTSNPFSKTNKFKEISSNTVRNPQIYSPPKLAAGPTPFSNLSLLNANPLTLQQNQAAMQLFPPKATAPAAGSSLFGNVGQAPNTSLFGSPAGQSSFGQFGQSGFGTSTGFGNTAGFGTTGFGSSTFGSPSNFQLQKPPTGNKRGKQ